MKRLNNYWTTLVATILVIIIAAPANLVGKAYADGGASSAAPASFTEMPSTYTQVQSPGLTRIRFAPGTTSALVSGDLPARTRARYVLRALAGQLMDVTLSAPQGAALFVTTSAGQPLMPLTGNPTSFRGYLPKNADYIIEVASGGQAVAYSVFVSIPQRISFKRGAFSATVSCNLSASQSQFYVLRALKGQTMQVIVTSAVPVQLIIYGVDGNVLKSGMGEGSNFSGVLPATQDYILVVRAGPDPARCSLQVTIR